MFKALFHGTRLLLPPQVPALRTQSSLTREPWPANNLLTRRSRALFQADPFWLDCAQRELQLGRPLTMSNKLSIGKTYNVFLKVPLTTLLPTVMAMAPLQIQSRTESLLHGPYCARKWMSFETLDLKEVEALPQLSFLTRLPIFSEFKILKGLFLRLFYQKHPTSLSYPPPLQQILISNRPKISLQLLAPKPRKIHLLSRLSSCRFRFPFPEQLGTRLFLINSSTSRSFLPLWREALSILMIPRTSEQVMRWLKRIRLFQSVNFLRKRTGLGSLMRGLQELPSSSVIESRNSLPIDRLSWNSFALLLIHQLLSIMILRSVTDMLVNHSGWITRINFTILFLRKYFRVPPHSLLDLL